MSINEFKFKSKGQLLQEAYRMHYEPYAKHFQFAVTLTLKLRETIKTPIYEMNLNLLGVLGIGRDISERKNAEQELLESKMKISAIVESTDDLIW